MSNIIYIISVLLVFIWSVCYFLWDAPESIHVLMLLSFLGILTSLFMDNKIKPAFSKK